MICIEYKKGTLNIQTCTMLKGPDEKLPVSTSISVCLPCKLFLSFKFYIKCYLLEKPSCNIIGRFPALLVCLHFISYHIIIIYMLFFFNRGYNLISGRQIFSLLIFVVLFLQYGNLLEFGTC